MPKIKIDEEKCIGCEACINACPADVLEMRDEKAKVKAEEKCIACTSCVEVCPTNAINIEE